MTDNEVITVGIDIGSLSTDAVILKDGNIIAYSVIPTLSSSETAASNVFQAVLDKAEISKDDISNVVATGYGRTSTPLAQKAVTEITCHAVGARHLFNEASTVIDIGGQDSKVIKLSADGRVEDFSMNDKCAAGTGRFLEVMARSLDTQLDLLGTLSKSATQDIRISSTCTVFAESEVVALVAKGAAKEDIIKGLHRSIAERIYGMVVRLRAIPPFVMTGGVAKNSGVVAAIEERLESTILLPEDPQIVGALGAAIIAGKGI